ncbi:septation protein SepH, partial [Nonomuraea sp. NPDC046802]|uniref:septation protein SepH n=1 Tax=Nonomuraea sp. NPDC046802 TaxID=3154919 RepID=UPI0033D0F7A1
MQELRLVAVSEDGTYLVLATAGRGTRFTLPVDDRLRAAVRGNFSRLGQYEIEVESPLRPKEIQARIRAGETAEEIAATAGIPVERVRWFEGPVLQEREYVAQQAQRVAVRMPGESAPGPTLGDLVAERLTRRGVPTDEIDWDSAKRDDGLWRVKLGYVWNGHTRHAEWLFDPRKRHVTPHDDEAMRLSAADFDPEPAVVEDTTVTPFTPRVAKLQPVPPLSSVPSVRREPEEPAVGWPSESAYTRGADTPSRETAFDRRDGSLSQDTASTQDPGHRLPGTGSHTHDTGHRLPGAGSHAPDTGHRIPDTATGTDRRTPDTTTGHRLPDTGTGHRIPDTGADTGHRLPDTDRRTLDPGTGHRVPGTGADTGHRVSDAGAAGLRQDADRTAGVRGDADRETGLRQDTGRETGLRQDTGRETGLRQEPPSRDAFRPEPPARDAFRQEPPARETGYARPGDTTSSRGGPSPWLPDFGSGRSTERDTDSIYAPAAQPPSGSPTSARPAAEEPSEQPQPATDAPAQPAPAAQTTPATDPTATTDPAATAGAATQSIGTVEPPTQQADITGPPAQQTSVTGSPAQQTNITEPVNPTGPSAQPVSTGEASTQPVNATEPATQAAESAAQPVSTGEASTQPVNATEPATQAAESAAQPV